MSEEYASCWVHQDCHVADQQKAPLKKTAGLSGGKDECQVRLKWTERDYCIGTEIGMLGDYGFLRQVTAGDGSDKLEKAKFEQDVITLEEKRKSSSAKWDVRKKAPAQIGLNWQHFYWRFVTR